MDYKLELINQILDTDLGVFTEDDAKLEFAITYAQNQIASRHGCAVVDIPAKYDTNIVAGAVWYLARIGSEGESENTEGVVTRVYKDTPDWLKAVVPKIGVVKLAGTR